MGVATPECWLWPSLGQLGTVMGARGSDLGKADLCVVREGGSPWQIPSEIPLGVRDASKMGVVAVKGWPGEQCGRWEG